MTDTAPLRDGRAPAGAAGRGPRPRQALPDHARGSSSSARSARCTPWTASPSTSRGARRWALVGETGCGKSTDGRADPAAARAHQRHRSASTATRSPRLAQRTCKPLRRQMQMIFQDPYSSLNPRKTVGTIIGEPFPIHGMKIGARRAQARGAGAAWSRWACNPEHYNRYPHEFSGGQRQRIGVARALALKPEAASSPTSRSRRSTSRSRRRSSTCCEDLQRELGLTYVFIAHDLSVVRHMCDRVAVMYLGKIVELAAGRHALRASAPPLHGRAAVGRAGARSPAGRRAGIAAAERRRAQPDQPAAGLPLPHPLPEGAGALLRHDEPPLERKDGGGVAACHFPLTDDEVAERVPTAAA